jgi:small subunit ribosomal protein S13
MHLLGHNLPDHKLLKVRTSPFPSEIGYSKKANESQVALTSFYGLSHATTPRLLARLQIPTSSKVSDLTESQITSLSAFLSSPATTPAPAPTPLAITNDGETNSKGKEKARLDPLDGLRIETDLKRDIQGDIAHLRQVGAYRGKR